MTKKPKEKPPAEAEPRSRERPSFALDPAAIKAEYTTISSALARQGEMLAEASKEAAVAKLLKKQREAEIYVALLEDAGEKKPPEPVLKARVTLHPKVQAASVRLIDAEYARDQIMSDMEALRTKRDMTVSLGAHVRLELRADPSLREEDDDFEDDDEDDDE